MSESEMIDTGDQLSKADQDKRITLQKSYTWWSIALAVIGILNVGLYFLGMATSSQTPSLYLLAAAATFYFRVTSMLLVIAVLFAWTAVGNLLTVLFNNESLFAFDILLFAILAYRVFRQYQQSRSLDDEEVNSPTGVAKDRQSRLALAKRLFPVGGIVIVLLSLGVFVFVWIITAILIGADPTMNTLPVEGVIYGITLSATFFAFAVSLASYFSGYPRKRMALLGTISAVVAYIIQLGLMPAQV